MLKISEKNTLIILGLLLFILTMLLIYTLKRKKKKQLDIIFSIIFVMFIFWILGLISQIICSSIFSINPIYFEYFVYISVCFLPVAFLFLALIFVRTKIEFDKKYFLLFVIPSLSLILLWTNNWHHLFYEKYSLLSSETIFGFYFYIHTFYTYILLIISLFILMKYSIKNSGFFSKQALLILIGAIIPILTNVLGFIGIISISIYITPITLSFTIICFTFAIFKFNLFKATPIALQRIVDRISDSYIVLDEDNIITDFNQTFITTFKIKNSATIRGKDFYTLLKEKKLDLYINEFDSHIKKVESSDLIESFEIYLDTIQKHFNIEITSIIVNKQFLGILILLKDITQHIKDMQNLKDNQSVLMEQERLASLGQMIGGIAHNLKTPIMSISGAIEGLNDLVTEYDASIGDPDVTIEDHHAIAGDMKVWLNKIKTHISYMSDVITAVKGQAVTFSDEQISDFNVEELLKMVSILMKHELSRAQVSLNIENHVPLNIPIHGNINSLVQVVNNIISNAIQASEKATNKVIDLTTLFTDSNVVISIRDYGCGIPDSVKDTLFKKMITTKGKNGTGLGLFMSYSNIKAHFNGDLTFESEPGKGTTFNIILPI